MDKHSHFWPNYGDSPFYGDYESCDNSTCRPETYGKLYRPDCICEGDDCKGGTPPAEGYTATGNPKVMEIAAEREYGLPSN
jgi:hypothetical protein